ncbi:hypothetical protein BJX70DRAFT_396945 [Aspergillus crustosus]
MVSGNAIIFTLLSTSLVFAAPTLTEAQAGNTWVVGMMRPPATETKSVDPWQVQSA